MKLQFPKPRAQVRFLPGALPFSAPAGRGAGATHVDLCWVDEVALALIDLAIAKNRALGLVYPPPAGQVAVLVAAQLSPGTTWQRWHLYRAHRIGSISTPGCRRGPPARRVALAAKSERGPRRYLLKPANLPASSPAISTTFGPPSTVATR